MQLSPSYCRQGRMEERTVQTISGHMEMSPFKWFLPFDASVCINADSFWVLKVGGAWKTWKTCTHKHKHATSPSVGIYSWTFSIRQDLVDYWGQQHNIQRLRMMGIQDWKELENGVNQHSESTVFDHIFENKKQLWFVSAEHWIISC